MEETYSVSGAGVKEYFCKTETSAPNDLGKLHQVDLVVKIRLNA